ncbi:MAG: hypothetical protein K8R90_09065 [Candidatus Cloacimonetes bacterium]|nr:hypothetical protein [Candidatus Cloacimonadota bacterium]
MLIKRRWHISWSGTDSQKTHSLSLSVRSVFALLALAALFLLALGGSFVWLLVHSVSDDAMAELEQENVLLRQSVGSLSAQIDSVQVRLKLMEDWEERVRKDDNLRQLEEGLFDDAGGASDYDPDFLPPIDATDESEGGK